MIPKLVHHKQQVLNNIKLKSDPNWRHIREWTDDHIQPKRLIRDMIREGYISQEYETVGKTVKRHLKPLVDTIIEP